MTPPRTLEDFDAGDDAVCDDLVGDTIQYRAAGAPSFTTHKAYVDYADSLRSIETGQVIEQDISVELRKALIAAKPTAAARITLARLPGRTFKPVNVRSSSDGAYWIFEVQQIHA